jgi:hypothetical protein
VCDGLVPLQARERDNARLLQLAPVRSALGRRSTSHWWSGASIAVRNAAYVVSSVGDSWYCIWVANSQQRSPSFRHGDMASCPGRPCISTTSVYAFPTALKRPLCDLIRLGHKITALLRARGLVSTACSLSASNCQGPSNLHTDTQMEQGPRAVPCGTPDAS